MTEQIMIGVGAVIQDAADRILLVKHVPERGGYWQGKWICPGGRLEPGSDVGEARWVEQERLTEVWEELHEDTRRLLRIAGVVASSKE